MVARPPIPPRARRASLFLLGLVVGACSEGGSPAAPAPGAASRPADPPVEPRFELPAPPVRPTRLAGLVVDPLGSPLGAGVRVAAVGAAMGELVSPGARRAERLGTPVVTDAQGRFELGPRELDLPLPLRLVAVSETVLGTLHVAEDSPAEALDLRLVVRPLVGRRVRLIDQEGAAVRWPAEALSASVFSNDPSLAVLDPEAVEWELLPFPAQVRDGARHGERIVLAESHGFAGRGPLALDWSLELAGYDFARLRVELRPLVAGTELELLEGRLERTAAGFGAVEVGLPPGLGGAQGEPLAAGLGLLLEPRAGRRGLAYELRHAEQGRVRLADVPAGEYGARLEVRGVHRVPPADAPALTLVVPVDGEVALGLPTQAWAPVEVEVELPTGELHAGRLHLELSVGQGQALGSAAVREFRTFKAPPYRFGPSPVGGYTLHVRRLPGFVEGGAVRDPFAGIEERDLPWTQFELRPDATVPVRLRLAP